MQQSLAWPQSPGSEDATSYSPLPSGWNPSFRDWHSEHPQPHPPSLPHSPEHIHPKSASILFSELTRPFTLPLPMLLLLPDIPSTPFSLSPTTGLLPRPSWCPPLAGSDASSPSLWMWPPRPVPLPRLGRTVSPESCSAGPCPQRPARCCCQAER